MKWFLNRIINYYPFDIHLANQSYTKQMAKDLGEGYKNTSYYYSDGFEYSFRDQADFKRLKIFLKKRFNKCFVQKWSKEIKRRADIVLKTTKKTFSSKNSFKRLLSLFYEEHRRLLGIFQLPYLCQLLLKKADQKLLYKFGLAREQAARLIIKVEKIYRIKLGSLMGISKNQALMLLPEEVMIFLKNNTFPKDYKKRKSMFLTTRQGKTRVFWNKKADQVFKKIKLISVKPTKEIKGQPAYKGKVKGRAYLALNVKEFKKIPQNAILVCSTTRYDIVKYLKRVRAIVADQGGITSHAAIVSREMKIPCVVGTYLATQVLKSGNKLEVNADKGIVRKLTK